MKALIFDTETTGIPKHPDAKDEAQPRIIEFGGILINEDFDEIEHLTTLINPGVPLDHLPPMRRNDKSITDITGITENDLKNKPTFKEAHIEIEHMFAAADVLIAHNLPFDKKMIELELERNGIKDWPWPEWQICTVQEHAEAWGRRPRLIELYEHYMGEPLKQTHRALDDVRALVEVVRKSGVFS